MIKIKQIFGKYASTPTVVECKRVIVAVTMVKATVNMFIVGQLSKMEMVALLNRTAVSHNPMNIRYNSCHTVVLFVSHKRGNVSISTLGIFKGVPLLTWNFLSFHRWQKKKKEKKNIVCSSTVVKQRTGWNFNRNFLVFFLIYGNLWKWRLWKFMLLSILKKTSKERRIDEVKLQRVPWMFSNNLIFKFLCNFIPFF